MPFKMKLNQLEFIHFVVTLIYLNNTKTIESQVIISFIQYVTQHVLVYMTIIRFSVKTFYLENGGSN